MNSLVGSYASNGFCSEISEGFLKNEDPNEPWHITADYIEFDQRTNEYIARGQVVISKKGKKLTADHVRFDQNRMRAVASGSVAMSAGEDLLLGSRIEIDLNQETGTIYDGSLFYKANHFYIKGDRIQKTGPLTYTVDSGSLTSCDGDRPAWRLTGRNLKVNLGGYGTVKHATLWARKMPVGYVPYMVFPVKEKRQSGLLLPQAGTSDRRGLEYMQPLFWAINPQSDATLYWHHMGRRGEKVGLEYRYAVSESTQGALMFDYFEDFKRDDGVGTNSRDWGYVDDDHLRPNTDRYWLRMKHDQQLPDDWTARLDLDVVSDQDYLLEFKSGLTGFDQTEAYFQDTFGRDLDDYTDPVRVNRLYLSRGWSQFHLNAEARWFDDVIARRLLDTDTTLHKLPRIGFNASKQRLLQTPLYYDLQSEYIHFYRLTGTRGHRADVHPRVYLPLKFKNYLTMEPSVGVRQTVWHLDEIANDGSQPDLAAGDRTLFRELFDLKLDLFTNLQKQYALNSKTIDRIQHRLRPQLIYEYIPGQAQSHLPNFDDIDRIAATNKISYSLTSLWIARAPKTADRDDSIEDTVSAPNHRYTRIARLKLEQSYDIERAANNQPEPFSPLSAELTFDAFRYLSLDAEAEWSFERNEFDSHSVAVVARDRRGDSLSVEHRYTQSVSQSLIAGLNLNINDQLSAVASYERNLKTGESIQLSTGLRYRSQCWSAEFRYAEEGQTRDRSYLMLINLHGLGSFSSN